MAGRGRSQREPMERLVRLLAVLSQAGPAGVGSDVLVRVAGFGEGDPVSQLNRDFAHLRTQGWQIDNVAGSGETARYRLVRGDNRLRLRLSSAQQAALQRAALLADRAELGDRLGLAPGARPAEVSADVLLAGQGAGLGEGLDTVVAAVRERRLLRFRYKGRERTAHPAAVRHQNGRWYLTALEDGPGPGSGSASDREPKSFVVERMTEVTSAAPGTARRVGAARRSLHPLQWEVDEPVDVVLRTPVEYVADVERRLLAPTSVTVEAGVATMTYRCTHRAALRQRLYMLGTRVELVGPDDVRTEMLDELREMAGI
jgi:predicted DNA-binding transcriptional regulator YafY